METGVLDRLISELGSLRGVGGVQVGTRATPSTPSLPYYTGVGGLFGVAGLERDVISSRVQPIGLADRIPAVGTNRMFPMFAYLTGFQAGTGANAEGVCDDPPTAGAGKSCIQTAQFGRYSFQTRTLEVNHLGQEINRGEFADIRFLNDPLAGGVGGLTVPNVPGAMTLRREMLMRKIELGVSFQLSLSRQIYEGNPANNSAGGGYKEFPGLDILVGTDKVDALTGTPCEALDSDIKDFNYARVDAAEAGLTPGTRLMNYLSAMFHYLKWNAQSMNFGDTQWAIVMRPDLFWEVSAIWACAYLTYRCQMQGNAEVVVDGNEVVRFRDDMRNGNYLMVDGTRYPVILDNNIREETGTTSSSVASGCYASDIYILPLTVRGGYPTLYWEYYDYRNGPTQGIADANATAFYWTDAGRYLWHVKPPQNWCIQLLAKMEPRIILRTPQLAGRLTNVLYCPMQHTRDPRTTDPYFLNGGQSTQRYSPSMWADWGSVNNQG